MRVPGLLVVVLFATAVEAQQSSPGIIMTSGRAQASLTPASASVELIVETRGPSASDAAGQNGTRQQRIIEALRRLGFSADQVQLASFKVRANTNYETQKLLFYEAEASITVLVKPLDRLGTVIDSSLAAGATEVRDIDFTSDSVGHARERLLAQAVAAARHDAETLAQAAGGELGRLVDVSTFLCSDRIGDVLALQPGVVGNGFASQTSIASMTPGNVDVRVTVCTRWELVKKAA